MTQDAGVPLVLVNPMCNLADCPPFKSQHRDDLDPEDRRAFHALWEQAREHYHANKMVARKYLREALALDDQFAAIHYELGKCLESLAEPDEARAAFIRAKEMDVCPLRILEPMNAAVLTIARRTHTPVVDVRRMFSSASRDGILGGDWLVDHVHPSVQGHKRIAHALFEKLVELRMVKPGSDWLRVRDEKFAQHEKTLDDFYYADGMRHLEAVKAWARGRGGGPNDE